MTDLDQLLVTTVARHFPEATTDGDVVNLGFAGLRLRCGLGNVGPGMGIQTVQLLFWLDGGGFRGPIELSITGYERSRESALVAAACGWTCTLGPLLQQALAGNASGKRSYVDIYDRVLYFSQEGGEPPADARARLRGTPNLAARVIDSGRLPLSTEHPSILSVFVGEMPGRTIVEVRLDNEVYDDFDDLVAGAPAPPAKEMVLLRDLAVILPA